VSGVTCFYFGDFSAAHDHSQRTIELYDQARATPISPTGSARISASQRRFSTQSHCGCSVKSTRLCHLPTAPSLTPSSACSGPSFRLSALSDPAGVAALHVVEREGKDFVYVGKSRHRLQSKIINGNPQEA